jgi:hypothetical protein
MTQRPPTEKLTVAPFGRSKIRQMVLLYERRSRFYLHAKPDNRRECRLQLSFPLKISFFPFGLFGPPTHNMNGQGQQFDLIIIATGVLREE